MNCVKELNEKLAQLFGGCYLLYDGEEIVYVGQSENCGQRIRTHIEEKEKQFNSFRYIQCHDREKLEALLIDILRPKYNKAITHSANVFIDCVGSQQTRLETALDKIIALHNRNDGNGNPCGWSSFQDLFGRFDCLQRTKIKDICKKYGAVIDYERPCFDLTRLVRYKNLIEHDLIELENDNVCVKQGGTEHGNN